MKVLLIVMLSGFTSIEAAPTNPQDGSERIPSEFMHFIQDHESSTLGNINLIDRNLKRPFKIEEHETTSHHRVYVNFDFDDDRLKVVPLNAVIKEKKIDTTTAAIVQRDYRENRKRNVYPIGGFGAGLGNGRGHGHGYWV